MKVLLTGSHGYIGQHVADRLTRHGFHYIPFDLRQERDITDRCHCRYIMRGGYDVVIHLAAETNIGAGEQSPGHFYAVNVQGTINLLKEAAAVGVKRFVLASSAAVYGDQHRTMIPTSVYGWTKLQAENALQNYCNRFGMTGIALRIFNACGHNHRSFTHVIPNLVRSALTGEAFHLTADVHTVRDYIHVDDVADAILHFSKPIYALTGFQSIDVGTGIGTDLGALIDKVQKATHSKIKQTRGETRPNEVRRLVSHLCGMQEHNFSPKKTLDEAINSAVRSLLKQAV